MIDLRMLHMSLILHNICNNELWTFAGHKINFELVIHCTSGTSSKLDLLVTSSHHLFLLRVTSYSSENRNNMYINIERVINTNHGISSNLKACMKGTIPYETRYEKK